MNQELDYAEMLEIPVSTVNVVKKKSFNPFKRKAADKQAEKQAEKLPQQDDLKELVVDSVNERVGAYVYSEDLSEPAVQEEENEVKTPFKKLTRDRGSIVLFSELIAVCVIALAIFITNMLMPQSAINTFIGSFKDGTPTVEEPAYTSFTLTPVVSDFSDVDITVASNGVLSFKAKGAVYPVCEGTVASISQESENVYSVQIAHTSTFKSVITGLTNVYAEKGTKVAANIPFAYSDGESEVQVSMYDGDTLLNCYTLNGVVPAWNS